jgi:hypothetical protein
MVCVAAVIIAAGGKPYSRVWLQFVERRWKAHSPVKASGAIGLRTRPELQIASTTQSFGICRQSKN